MCCLTETNCKHLGDKEASLFSKFETLLVIKKGPLRYFFKMIKQPFLNAESPGTLLPEVAAR